MVVAVSLVLSLTFAILPIIFSITRLSKQFTFKGFAAVLCATISLTVLTFSLAVLALFSYFQSKPPRKNKAETECFKKSTTLEGSAVKVTSCHETNTISIGASTSKGSDEKMGPAAKAEHQPPKFQQVEYDIVSSRSGNNSKNATPEKRFDRFNQ